MALTHAKTHARGTAPRLCAVLQDAEVRRAKMNGEIKKHLTQILLEVTDAVLGGVGGPQCLGVLLGLRHTCWGGVDLAGASPLAAHGLGVGPPRSHVAGPDY